MSLNNGSIDAESRLIALPWGVQTIISKVRILFGL